MLGYISRFSVVGVVATAVYFVVANVLISLTLLAPEGASVLAYIAGMIVSFLGQSRYTFKVETNTSVQLVRFCIVSALGMFISWGWLRATELLQVSAFWGTVLVSISIPLISFVAMKLWVFQPTTNAQTRS